MKRELLVHEEFIFIENFEEKKVEKWKKVKIENKEVDDYYEFRKKRVKLFLWSRSGKALKDGAAPVMVRSRSRLER